MRFLNLGRVLRSALPVLGLLALGCGPKFDPPSELQSLRVLGVQKDKPYAKPGDTINLQMLWEDASVDAASPSRKVQVVWSPPCFNPDGDLFYGCFTNAAVFAAGMAGAQLGVGNTTTVDTSAAALAAAGVSELISRPAQSGVPAYGIAFVFFAVCAGTLVPITTTDQTAIPIGCQDAAGNLLGSDDFVAGYTSIYFYSDTQNNNPFVSGFEFQDTAVGMPAFCTDHSFTGSKDARGPDNCQAIAGAKTAPDVDCHANPELCVPTCPDDGDSKNCPGYDIRPTVDKTDPANQDVDTTSGTPLGEQMWIDYYADAGKFKSSVRLLNDATAGWNDDYGTQFYAPKAPGSVRVWALVHDNRGGVGWSGVTLKVQ
jgi:hypothetical protein